METKLARIEEISRNNAKIQFTSLYHLINKELLMECHKELDGKKAKGIDGVTKDEYNNELEENLNKLIIKLKNKAYKPLPANRVYIPKGNGKMRPLAISVYEDKIVQMALKKVIEAVYEPRFLECMYGFRPNRSCHDALKRVNRIIEKEKVSYILDADIKGFFNHLQHEWIIEFVKVHIKDPNVLWLINKLLKSGIVEDGEYEETEEGSGQGSLCSPILANIYMHYVLALWFYKIVKPVLRGYGEIIIYADDFICCFQYRNDAENFLRMVKERFSKYGLELEENKTRLIEFGRFAENNGKKKGTGKPKTFNFLGFTHYCSKGRKGNFRVKRKTDKKKFTTKVKEITKWIKEHRHWKVRELIKVLNVKLMGHYRYYGITDNGSMIGKFAYETSRALIKWLNRRSQKKSYTFEGYNEMLKYNPLVKPKIYVNIYEIQS